MACVGLYLLSALTGFPDTSSVCLAAAPVLHGQAFRVLTAALSHAGLLHLGMNMLAFLPLGEGVPANCGVRAAAVPGRRAGVGSCPPAAHLPALPGCLQRCACTLADCLARALKQLHT